MSGLNNSKAKDIYGLDTSLLKSHKEALASPIMHLVNLSSCIVWKLASVTPVFKAGDKTDMNNYRPISSLPIASKIIEKLVAKQIIEFLGNSQTPLHPMQFGFRPYHCTETALTMFMSKKQVQSRSKWMCWCRILRFKKSIWHRQP